MCVAARHIALEGKFVFCKLFENLGCIQHEEFVWDTHFSPQLI